MEKSLICPLDPSAASRLRAVDETERYAREVGMDETQSLHLRLLCEELTGMIGSLLNVSEGSYWVAQEEGGYSLHLEVTAPVGKNAKSLLLGAATDGKNASYEGVTGKIRMFLDEVGNLPVAVPTLGVGAQNMSAAQASHLWSYRNYRETAAKDAAAAADWDNMELSVLHHLTRDILVGVRQDQVSIVLKAK